MRDDVAPVIGLDIGTSRLVAAKKEGQGFHFEAQLNALVNIPFSRMTENVLRSENVPFVVNGNEISVFGNAAGRFADLLSVDIRRPMMRGVLNPQEPQSLSHISRLVGTLLGEHGRGRKVCFSSPAPPAGSEESVTYHEASIKQMLEGLGCEAQVVNEGMAVIYSELQDTNFTGVGVSCGGGLCNVAMSYMSIPVFTFSTLKGGDFVDQSAASVTGELSNRIRITKESAFHFNGFYTEKVMQALTIYYDELIQSVVNGLREAFRGTRNVPRISRPVPLVLSGGSAMPTGFRERFAKMLDAADLPLKFAEVRMAADPLTATARGALIAGLAE